jgi:hypothetical protein
MKMRKFVLVLLCVVLLCACAGENAPVEAESEYEKEDLQEEIVTYEEPEEAGEPFIEPETNNSETPTFIYSNFEYRKHEWFDGLEIVQYIGEDKEVDIPSFIHDVPVVVIGESAFMGMELEYVSIPESVVLIEALAFEDNENITISFKGEIYTYEERFSAHFAVYELNPDLVAAWSAERDVSELYIAYGYGHNFSTGYYPVTAISLDGTVKTLMYEYTNRFEIHRLDIHRFANAIHNQMNDDSIPVLFQLDSIPDNIIELSRTADIADFNKSTGIADENWVYYIIVGTGEERIAIYIGGRWGSDGFQSGGSNELTRAINEYLETTNRTAAD